MPTEVSDSYLRNVERLEWRTRAASKKAALVHDEAKQAAAPESLATTIDKLIVSLAEIVAILQGRVDPDTIPAPTKGIS